MTATARQARLRLRLRRGGLRLCLATALFVAIAGGSRVLACPVCFGAEETSMIDGAKLGVLAMLVITFAVQGAFLAFFLYLRKRAKHIADVDLDTEWSELQGAPKTL
jgi:hypothetical protein